MTQHFYRVQYGDTLPMISERFYGTPDFGPAIFDVNRDIMHSASHPTPGQDLVIPHIGPMAVH